MNGWRNRRIKAGSSNFSSAVGTLPKTQKILVTVHVYITTFLVYGSPHYLTDSPTNFYAGETELERYKAIYSGVIGRCFF